MESYTEQGFPSVPPLEPSLSSVFGVQTNMLGGRRPTLPNTTDQMTARFADRSHQCNIALLACSVDKIAAEPKRLPERAEELGKAASAALNICALIAVTTARTAAWQQLIRCNIWLHLSSSIPDNMKKELLEGPISPEGLLGLHLHSVVDQLQKTSEEAEKFKSHVSRAQRDAGPQRSSGHCGTAGTRGRDAPLLLLLLRPGGATRRPAARRGQKNRRMAPSWSNPTARAAEKTEQEIMTFWGDVCMEDQT